MGRHIPDVGAGIPPHVETRNRIERALTTLAEIVPSKVTLDVPVKFYEVAFTEKVFAGFDNPTCLILAQAFIGLHAKYVVEPFPQGTMTHEIMTNDEFTVKSAIWREYLATWMSVCDETKVSGDYRARAKEIIRALITFWVNVKSIVTNHTGMSADGCAQTMNVSFDSHIEAYYNQNNMVHGKDIAEKSAITETARLSDLQIARAIAVWAADHAYHVCLNTLEMSGLFE